MFVGLIKTMRRTFLLYSVILLCFAGVFNANAQTTDLLASKDNTIYSDGDSSNGSGSFLFVGTTSIGFERRALVRFDLSSLTPTDSVISAQLQMFVSKTKAVLLLHTKKEVAQEHSREMRPGIMPSTIRLHGKLLVVISILFPAILNRLATPVHTHGQEQAC